MTAEVAASVLAAGTWRVSDVRTRVTFAVGNLGRPARGSVACSWGELEVDHMGRPVRVRAQLDLDSLDTGIAKRDADLRKPRFLDIDRRPTMTWSADRFRSDEGGRWTADGVLCVRGTSAPVVVTGTVEAAPDGWARVRGTAALDRTSVGIRAPRLLIGRSVEIDVDAWLSHARPG